MNTVACWQQNISSCDCLLAACVNLGAGVRCSFDPVERQPELQHRRRYLASLNAVCVCGAHMKMTHVAHRLRGCSENSLGIPVMPFLFLPFPPSPAFSSTRLLLAFLQIFRFLYYIET